MANRIELNVWLEQFDLPIGKVSVSADENIKFNYAEEYLNLESSQRLPLSLSLPVRAEEYGDVVARPFFGNLLQENNQLEAIIAQHGIARGDIVGLLYYLGADCPGAISCLPVEEPNPKRPGILSEDYDLLSQEEVAAIIASLANREPLPNEGRDPSPLAGVQRKIAVTCIGDRYAVPKPDRNVPTTHIIKVPRPRDHRDVILETAALSLASRVGLNAAHVKAMQIDNIDYLLIERFDRAVTTEGHVYRVHQEDFAQAAGLAAQLKYERNGGEAGTFNVATIINILDQTDLPGRNKLNFILLTLFNMVVGNTDNHAKNHALLYTRGEVPSVAPCYDILPISLDTQYTDEFSFKVGDAERLSDITGDDVREFVGKFGYNKAAIDRFCAGRLAGLFTVLEHETAGLVKARMKDLDDLIGSNLAQLSEELELGLDLRERDFVPERRTSGAWGVS